ncbi:hypothetical protein [Streptomyces sp. NPDC005438]|uniref:HelD family protein n=1 Tax=Streptomyces sp. NPDC005438 TaxID=3156880 RepID=UPI00339F4025
MSSAEIEKEQSYVSMLYGRLDQMREEERRYLNEALAPTSSGHQARTEREATVGRRARALARLTGVEEGLCCGRIDLENPERNPPRYVGRVGIRDERDDFRPLLVDWRAPAARPFYTATAASPEGVRRRRHLATRGRTVTGLHDEPLHVTPTDPEHESLTGEAALLAALTARRTGRMRDVVATLQAEQDRIIRDDHRGVLVVEGGPGTGKTAVALHRAAYLLYSRRELLERRGVLIVGPHPVFLRYVEQVLPSLGETSVMLATVAELFPGVRATGVESSEAAEVKGRPEMVRVLARAVEDRQGRAEGEWEVPWERETLWLTPEIRERARGRALAAGLTHEQARPLFVRALLEELSDQVAELIGTDPLGGENLLDEPERAQIREELADTPEFHRALAELWPSLTPQRLLRELFAEPERLEWAADGPGGLTARERRSLHRPADSPWTAADVPLLDELAELLGAEGAEGAEGTDDTEGAEERGAEEAEREEEVAYARGALELAYGSRSQDEEEAEVSEVLSAFDLLDAEALAERYRERDQRTVAERAATDRHWAFGHLIVDEAQELSAMDLRLLMRRCPSRSMTLVGDLAQSGSPGAVRTWAELLEPHQGDRWRRERLTVNYRTAAEIAEVASGVLAATHPDTRPPRAVRHSGVPPWRMPVTEDRLPAVLGELVAREAAEVGDGRLAVVVPDALRARLAQTVRAAVPHASVGPRPDLTRGVTLLGARQAKGLEFDSVLLVRPETMAGAPGGPGDLYVAVSRATERLGVLHVGPPPAGLDRLPVRGGG